MVTGVGKVRHEHDRRRDRPRRSQPLIDISNIVCGPTQSVHPRVDLQPHFERISGIRQLEHAQLLFAMDDEIDPVTPEGLQFRRVGDSLE